jgi:elongation factor Ts
MMDCKAALGETGGDLEAAVDWLRKKGLAKAAKKAGRIAAEGLIGIALADNKGVVAEVNSETDFVARNQQFQSLVRMITDVALQAGADVDAVKVARIGNETVADAIASAIATIGENIALRRVEGLSVNQGLVASYVHNSLAPNLGKIGVLVALESAGKTDELAAIGRQLAMHVASANPQALDPGSLDPAAVAREKDVLADKAKAQGKPANVIDKIVESGLKTYYKEVTLVDQLFIFDDKKSVAQAVKEAEGKVGAPIRIAGYVRYALGEGIERPDSAMADAAYQRVIVKVSGEALAGSDGYGINQATIDRIAADLVAAHRHGVALGVVVGGGNILRGVRVYGAGLPRATADSMGMLATVVNALVLETAIERAGAPARSMSALSMPQVCETYERQRALRHLADGRIVLFAGGTGNPYFTTDTTAVLRAAEMGCQAVLKATNVDGVYSADPKTDTNAQRFDRISHQEAIDRGLKVMDATAFALARENLMPIIVFSIAQPGAIEAVVCGRGRATIVGG